MTTTAERIAETRFVLPADTLIVSVESLPEVVRANLDHHAEDFAVARPRTRAPTRIVSPEMAALLEEFRTPSRLVDVVLRYSRQRGLEPQSCLEEAFPALQHMTEARLLVVEGMAGRADIEPNYVAGDRLGRFRIVTCLRALDDTEVYTAVDEATGELVAVKLWYPGSGLDTDAIEREATILEYLEGGFAPRLVAHAPDHDPPYLVSSWRTGVPVTVAADEARRDSAGPGRAAIADIALGVLDAYASLHEAGVVHGDVNPANVLVDADGTVSIIDYGAATLSRPGAPALGPTVPTAVGSFYDPQTAAAIVGRSVPPPANQLAEQYAIGVLIYRVLTGAFPVDFSLEADELLRQVLEDPPRPFVQLGVEPWPQVEIALRRAMEKRPADRFDTVAQFAAAVRAARVHQTGTGLSAPAIRVGEPRVDAMLADLGFDSPWLFGDTALTDTNVWRGRTGVAWCLYRAALALGDPLLLAAADIWTARSDLPEGGDSRQGRSGTTVDDHGWASVLHSEAGGRAVATLVALERCDPADAGSNVSALACDVDVLAALDESRSPAGHLDNITLLRRAFTAHSTAVPAELDQIGRRSADRLIRAISAPPGPSLPPWLRHLGFAHGIGGSLHALLGSWGELSEDQRAVAERKLDDLAGARRPLGRGVVWPATWPGDEEATRTPTLAPGWCAGSAGFALLWVRASRVLGDREFTDLAERSAWTAWEHPDRNTTLCCGLPGRGIALLALYRLTGEVAWKRRARNLLDLLPRTSPRTTTDLGLFKGRLGRTLLALELQQPEHTTMPLIDDGSPIPKRPV